MDRIYAAAKSFLCRELSRTDANDIVESYLSPPKPPIGLSRKLAFRQLVISAQNANMKAAVIGQSIGGVDELRRLLFDFNPDSVLSAYAHSPNALLERIVSELRPRGKVRTEANSIWPRYCTTILSAAEFIGQFKSDSDFLEWTDSLYTDERSAAALPMLVSAQVYGIGYALACDFLKDIGFANYSKPDVHVRKILKELNVCDDSASPFIIQRTMGKIAASAGVTPFAVDKCLWLIGSWKFYNHPEILRSEPSAPRIARFANFYGTYIEWLRSQ